MLLAALFLGSQAFAQTDAVLFPPKPEPAVYVHDYAGWLTPDEKARLEQKLVRYSDTTSTQIVVMLRPDIGDYDKASYAFELGNRWGIGRKQKNNGVVVLIKTAPPDRGVFIATGYGAEGALPDITAARITRNVMIPRFQQEQHFQGIDAGLDAIIAALSGEFKADPQQSGDFPVGLFLLGLLLFLVFIFFMAWKFRHSTMYSGSGPNRRVKRNNDDWWGGGIGGLGGGGWGSSGGGGWSSGGGGGSFGGGSFGGGGAGGDW